MSSLFSGTDFSVDTSSLSPYILPLPPRYGKGKELARMSIDLPSGQSSSRSRGSPSSDSFSMITNSEWKAFKKEKENLVTSLESRIGHLEHAVFSDLPSSVSRHSSLRRSRSFEELGRAAEGSPRVDCHCDRRGHVAPRTPRSGRRPSFRDLALELESARIRLDLLEPAISRAHSELQHAEDTIRRLRADATHHQTELCVAYDRGVIAGASNYRTDLITKQGIPAHFLPPFTGQ